MNEETMRLYYKLETRARKLVDESWPPGSPPPTQLFIRAMVMSVAEELVAIRKLTGTS